MGDTVKIWLLWDQESQTVCIYKFNRPKTVEIEIPLEDLKALEEIDGIYWHNQGLLRQARKERKWESI